MDTQLEVWSGGDSRLFPLGLDDVVSIGRGGTNQIALPFDPTVSRVHAVISRYAGGWCLRDVGSANGTYLNGRRVLGEQLLRPDDEIRIGAARLVFRGEPTAGTMPAADVASALPELTRSERLVLVALCRPLGGPGAFAQASTDQQIAEELVVSKKDVQFHLRNLYAKFGIAADGRSRRTRLANEAVERSVVSISELRRHPHHQGR